MIRSLVVCLDQRVVHGRTADRGDAMPPLVEALGKDVDRSQLDNVQLWSQHPLVTFW
jgi:hypothetical protein